MRSDIALLFGVALAGCPSGSPPGARQPPGPTSSFLARGEPGAAAPGPAEGPPLLEQGMPRLAPVLDDPRLAAAKDEETAGDDAAAAREVDRVAAGATLDPMQRCAWSYVSGRLHLAAGEGAEAAPAFETAAAGGESGAPCPLVSYARLRQAQALLRAGRYDEAIAVARNVGEDLTGRDEAQLVLADALAGKGDRAAAVPIWRDRLGANPRGFRWVDVALQLAGALLDGVDGPPSSRADEAFALTTRVLVEAPVAADKLDAAATRARAWAAKKSSPPPALTPEERARQAQAWLDAQQPKHAKQAAEELLKAWPRSEKAYHEALCKAAVVRAHALPHGKWADAALAWGDAIDRCDGEEALVTALYFGAKASSSAKRNDEALARYARIERLFPKHRLADDARLRASIVLQEEGDGARAVAMLTSLPDAYPEGDMRDEALFRVALDAFSRHDLTGAAAALDRMMALAPEPGRPVASPLSGRAEYFRARVAELQGDTADANKRYAALVAREPLTYYMLLAYSRLRDRDDSLARSTVEAAVASESEGPFLTREHAELASPGLQRFVRLLEVGEVEAARREAANAGLVGEGVDPEVVWTIAWLYDGAGVPETGHSFTRARLVDFRGHWPAGRWKLAWRVAYPRAWDREVSRESESTHVPTALTWAIMREESSFNPQARSAANAVGLMQLMATTARKVAAGTALPYDDQALERPEVSIALGTRLLSSLRASFPVAPALAIAAYNGGPTSVRRWLADPSSNDFDFFVERIPFDETRGYLKRVLASEAAYAFLYAPAALDELLTLPARLPSP
ncbi:MAG TPA: lytic transglycosylase domain-containing protein [Polyangiaceae bacterium]|nr:lytic transglycosylase domain-containing protein [Polyangiaceae bacterium]